MAARTLVYVDLSMRHTLYFVRTSEKRQTDRQRQTEADRDRETHRQSKLFIQAACKGFHMDSSAEAMFAASDTLQSNYR